MSLRLPQGLNVLALKPPVQPSHSDLSRRRRNSRLFHETHTAHSALPMRDISRLQFDEGDAWVIGGGIVDAIAQVAVPDGRALAEQFLDAGVGGAGAGRAGNGGPILGGGVLEGELDGGGVFEVVELVRVIVGEEKEVGAVALEEHGSVVSDFEEKEEQFKESTWTFGVGRRERSIPWQLPSNERPDRRLHAWWSRGQPSCCRRT